MAAGVAVSLADLAPLEIEGLRTLKALREEREEQKERESERQAAEQARREKVAALKAKGRTDGWR